MFSLDIVTITAHTWPALSMHIRIVQRPCVIR